MRSVSYQYGSDRRRRAVSLGLTILAHILIILLLLRLGPGLPRLIKPDRPLLSFDVTQTPDNADTQTTKGETKPKIKQSSGGAPPKPAPPQPVPPKPAEEVPPPPVVPMPATKSLFELGDISKLPRHAEDQAVADTSNPGTGSSAGADSGAAYGTSKETAVQKMRSGRCTCCSGNGGHMGDTPVPTSRRRRFAAGPWSANTVCKCDPGFGGKMCESRTGTPASRPTRKASSIASQRAKRASDRL